MGDAILGTYSDFKLVKTRSVVQVVIEVPVERSAEVTDLLGMPMPGSEVAVAIARIRPESVRLTPAEDPLPGNKPLSQVAGAYCGLVAFRSFLSERQGHEIHGTEEAAAVVRGLCGVVSRRELDTNPEAARKFNDLRADYRNWLHGVGEAA